VSTHRSHKGVKLGAKQLNISGFNRHRTFYLKNDSDSDKTDSSHESGKSVITWAWPTSTTII
jgi:hypothetical protein